MLQRDRRSYRSAVLAGALALALGVCAGLPVSAMPADDGVREALLAQAPDLAPGVLELALRAAACAERRGRIRDSEILTVIDYSRPSTEPRLFVFDLEAPALLYRELVAHGRGSGENRATSFSNVPGSRQTSLGLFVTLRDYVGRHGRSLRLEGLEPGINDRAFERAIVMHGAYYVSGEFAAEHGRLGRSFGCPALAPRAAQAVIDRIAGGTPVFAYYPDESWLRASPYLGTCTGKR